LEQAEQLFTAAEAIGYGSRPLLAFYGLSQAGRALAAAANTDQWPLRGHGITASNLSDDLLGITVQNSGKPGSSGSFVRLAQLLGSGTLTKPVPIAAIWDSIPELARRPLRAVLDHRRRPALTVIKLELQTPPSRSDYLEGNWRYQLRVTGLPPHLSLAGNSTADLAELLADYPTLAGGQPPPSDDEDEGHLHAPPLFLDAADGISGSKVFDRIGESLYLGASSGVTVGDAVDLSWPVDATTGGVRLPPSSSPGQTPELYERLKRHVETQQLSRLRAAKIYRDPDVRWAFPVLGDQVPLHPLLAWWAALYALSMLARYQPREWIAHLDVDHSQHAVALEAALNEALDACPELLLRALAELSHD
jgi:hypothetical protein